MSIEKKISEALEEYELGLLTREEFIDIVIAKVRDDLYEQHRLL